MKDKNSYSIELNTTQQEFLETMVEQYALQDTDKAVRILVDYARDNPDKLSEIFEQIRCLDC